MKLRAVLTNGLLLRRLRVQDSAIREAAADAAAEVLKYEFLRAGASAISVQSRGLRRSVGSNDPADADREFGTSTQAPSPWLAPVLPTALEPMRAAADAAAARAVSALGRRKK